MKIVKLASVTLVAAAIMAVQPVTLKAQESNAATFLVENGARDGVVTTDSGLQYAVLESGDGAATPGEDYTVLVNYVGRIPDGRLFDTAMRSPLQLTRVIDGWTEGLQLMSRGARYKFWVPPALGYGDSPPPSSPITAETVMEFEIELLDFISQEDLQALQAEREQQAPATE